MRRTSPNHRAARDAADPERAAVRALRKTHGRDPAAWPPDALATLRAWEAGQLRRKAETARATAIAVDEQAAAAAHVATEAAAAAEAARVADPPPSAEPADALVPTEAPPASGPATEADRG